MDLIGEYHHCVASYTSKDVLTVLTWGMAMFGALYGYTRYSMSKTIRDATKTLQNWKDTTRLVELNRALSTIHYPLATIISLCLLTSLLTYIEVRDECNLYWSPMLLKYLALAAGLATQFLRYNKRIMDLCTDSVYIFS